jgi:hypothetical protein
MRPSCRLHRVGRNGVGSRYYLFTLSSFQDSVGVDVSRNAITHSRRRLVPGSTGSYTGKSRAATTERSSSFCLYALIEIKDGMSWLRSGVSCSVSCRYQQLRGLSTVKLRVFNVCSNDPSSSSVAFESRSEGEPNQKLFFSAVKGK